MCVVFACGCVCIACVRVVFRVWMGIVYVSVACISCVCISCVCELGVRMCVCRVCVCVCVWVLCLRVCVCVCVCACEDDWAHVLCVNGKTERECVCAYMCEL